MDLQKLYKNPGRHFANMVLETLHRDSKSMSISTITLEVINLL